ncbi:hypothetical protein ACD591_19880 [Rufibacter glacialis]|uniref:STAS/SEC14 domain-containing protein n=1 Tax=Rufibacter glacialis TaxID=1259555 RepID=A0A5M8Q7K1_9BACT|nr:hypothetical protein [Rufibacter glacialis]KAA6430602.1 hypothetical protein FOE74_19190 [Rufibacter glacialis]GGK85079.1 hypothetical protein GCM10011405_36140 [Rufibacter glacialis]
MSIIAQNLFYQMQVERERNLIIIEAKGCWNSPEEIPFYLLHLKESLSLVQPGFSVLFDLRQLEEFSHAVRFYRVEAQKLMLSAGICQLVEVHDLSKTMSLLSMAIAEETGIPLNIFDCLQDARAWLSELRQR